MNEHSITLLAEPDLSYLDLKVAKPVHTAAEPTVPVNVIKLKEIVTPAQIPVFRCSLRNYSKNRQVTVVMESQK